MHFLKKLNTQLLVNTGWILASEGASRASRLVTIMALAAFLSFAEYGTAMLALALHEIFRVFMRSGAGPRIIQCAESELAVIASNGATLQWMIYLGLALLQLVGAQLAAYFYQNSQLADLLSLMALSYIFYPLVSVRVFLLQRANHMRYVGLAGGFCVMVENLGCALMLVLGAGLYAIVWAKIAAAIAWAIVFYFAPVRSVPMLFVPGVIVALSKYSGRILGAEITRVLRSQYDLLIAGLLLMPELLGIYSFAKSAGVGLGQSLSSAYIGVLYPHICKLQRAQAEGFKQAPIYLLSLAIGLIFVLQALVAPLYINWFFPAHWHESAQIVSLLCLTAIPALLVDTQASVLRAQNRLNAEFIQGVFCVVSSLAIMHLVAPASPLEFAQVVALTSVCWLCTLGVNLTNFRPILLKRVSL